MSTETLTPTIVTGHYGFADVHLHADTNHKLLLATKAFQTGDVISKFSASEVHEVPSRYTVQVNEQEHIILHPEFLQYINHSCNPNAFFNTSTMELEALRPIASGDEFTFFYPSTEWFMADPFACHCGEVNCIGMIKGAKELAKDLLKHYRLTAFIEGKVNEIND